MTSKTDSGVMIIKDGLGWGCVRNDGSHGGSTEYGWMPIDSAPIYYAGHVKKITDTIPDRLAYFYEEALRGVKVVRVERITEVNTTIIKETRDEANTKD